MSMVILTSLFYDFSLDMVILSTKRGLKTLFQGKDDFLMSSLSVITLKIASSIYMPLFID